MRAQSTIYRDAAHIFARIFCAGMCVDFFAARVDIRATPILQDAFASITENQPMRDRLISSLCAIEARFLRHAMRHLSRRHAIQRKVFNIKCRSSATSERYSGAMIFRAVIERRQGTNVCMRILIADILRFCCAAAAIRHDTRFRLPSAQVTPAPYSRDA